MFLCNVTSKLFMVLIKDKEAKTTVKPNAIEGTFLTLYTFLRLTQSIFFFQCWQIVRIHYKKIFLLTCPIQLMNEADMRR